MTHRFELQEILRVRTRVRVRVGVGVRVGVRVRPAKGTLRAATSAEPAPPSGSGGRESERRKGGMKPGACSN